MSSCVPYSRGHMVMCPSTSNSQGMWKGFTWCSYPWLSNPKLELTILEVWPTFKLSGEQNRLEDRTDYYWLLVMIRPISGPLSRQRVSARVGTRGLRYMVYLIYIYIFLPQSKNQVRTHTLPRGMDDKVHLHFCPRAMSTMSSIVIQSKSSRSPGH
jgi:hypothetical protein